MSLAVVLHHYDASPFTQKALRMLGLKGLSWGSVETPMTSPKPDLVALTGGYRGTPVLQIGADVYIDNQRIAEELERRFPLPSLFPFGNRGLAQMIGVWADTFFRAGLHMVIGLQSRQWPAAFLADRKAVFADLDFDAIAGEVDHARARLRACACALDAQLADGRPFVEGDRPSLADIHAYAVPWFARAAMPEVNDLLACFERLPPWEARVADLGEGNRTPIAAAAAHELARRARPRTEAGVDPADPQRLRAGQRVVVEPDDSRRGVVAGDLVVATAREIAVRHRHAAVGEVVVHFPRLGYRVTPG